MQETVNCLLRNFLKQVPKIALGVVTRQRAEKLKIVVKFSVNLRDFSLIQSVLTGSGPIQPAIQFGTWVFSPEVSGRDVKPAVAINGPRVLM
jgi:hypothetical protein